MKCSHLQRWLLPCLTSPPKHGHVTTKGRNLWANPNARVLDPFVKTGVFLREATRRFNDGLASLIPDPQERVNHILTKQIYGIAITELTALMARRSVYCSKYANSEHSICTAFDTPEATSGLNAPSTLGMTKPAHAIAALTPSPVRKSLSAPVGAAPTAGPGKKTTDAAKISRPTPTPLSTLTT